jgi:hypothetical protein
LAQEVDRGSQLIKTILTEDALGVLPVVDGAVSLDLAPIKIKTLKFVWSRVRQSQEPTIHIEERTADRKQAHHKSWVWLGDGPWYSRTSRECVVMRMRCSPLLWTIVVIVLAVSVPAPHASAGCYVLVPAESKVRNESGEWPVVVGGQRVGSQKWSFAAGTFTFDVNITLPDGRSDKGHIEWKFEMPPKAIPIRSDKAGESGVAKTPLTLKWLGQASFSERKKGGRYLWGGAGPIGEENSGTEGDAVVGAGRGQVFDSYEREAKYFMQSPDSIRDLDRLTFSATLVPYSDESVTPGDWPSWVYNLVYRWDPVCTGAGGPQPTMPVAGPQGGQPAKSTRGQELRQRFFESLFRVKILEMQLAMYRDLLVSLDWQWEDTRQAQYWSGVFDIATMAGSAFWKPVASAAGVLVVKQSLMRALIEKVLKAILKDTAKQVLKDFDGQGVSLFKLGMKASEAAAIKTLQKVFENDMTEKISTIVKMDYPGLMAAATTSGQLPPAYLKMVKDSAVGPASDTFGCFIDFAKAVDAGRTGHNQLDAIRLSMKGIRERRILPLTTDLDQAKRDLDVAKYAYDLYLKDHPEEER